MYPQDVHWQNEGNKQTKYSKLECDGKPIGMRLPGRTHRRTNIQDACTIVRMYLQMETQPQNIMLPALFNGEAEV